MKYIRQRGEVDCMIAALAMVTDSEYDDVRRRLRPLLRGTPDIWGLEYLTDHGFTYQDVSIMTPPHKPIGTFLMFTRPFKGSGGHAVAVDNCAIYDPSNPDLWSFEQLRSSGQKISAIYKVTSVS